MLLKQTHLSHSHKGVFISDISTCYCLDRLMWHLARLKWLPQKHPIIFYKIEKSNVAFPLNWFLSSAFISWTVVTNLYTNCDLLSKCFTLLDTETADMQKEKSLVCQNKCRQMRNGEILPTKKKSLPWVFVYSVVEKSFRKTRKWREIFCLIVNV